MRDAFMVVMCAMVICLGADPTCAQDARVSQQQRSNPFTIVQDRDWPMLTHEEALADLARLRDVLEQQFSYLTLRSVSLDALMNRAEHACTGGIRLDHFALVVQQLMCEFGDGHSGVRPFEVFLPEGYSPFLFGDTGNRIVAFREDRAALIDADFPYVHSINDHPIEEWIECASSIVPDGSPALVRRNAVRHLRFIRALNLMLGFDDDAESFHVILENEAGSETRTRVFELQERKPVYGEWLRRDSHQRTDGIAYLRIASMSRDADEDAMEFLNKCDSATGLIIDLRGNSGGSRDALRAVYPFLVSPDSPPMVANIAAYRVAPLFPRDHLESRFLYRAGDRRFDEPQRRVIDSALDEFKPAWLPPIEQFSPWHFFVLDATQPIDVTLHDRPLVVLMNGDCFSATDVFLGALAQLPNVTLVGTPSSGGSGRTVDVRLRHSRIPLRLSSMASYRPDGRLYDTLGIQPDVLAYPEPGYYIGASDHVLDRAVELIWTTAAHDSIAEFNDQSN